MAARRRLPRTRRVSIISAFLCQPYYDDKMLRFYSTANPVAATPYHTVDLAADMAKAWPDYVKGGPNSVVVRNGRIYVSFDLDDETQGGVLIFNYADVYPVRSATPAFVVRPGAVPGFPKGLASCGIAVEPVTGDLYIPTFYDTVHDSGVYKASAASNYAAVTQFASYLNDASVAEVCANLAFDVSGNLWMTTWSLTNSPDQHYLICYKGLDKNAYYKVKNPPAKYVATSPNGAAINVYLLSAPEGLAFDSAGHLWVGNNNDYFHANGPGEGTLLRIDAAWLGGMLAAAPASEHTVPPASVDVTYLSGGKLGGLAFEGNTIYVNDQGQNQGGDFASNGTVWAWDVTTPRTAANFKASGVHTIYPGNGGGAIVRPWLVTKDDALDTGSEPNTTTAIAWESQEIWVRQGSDGALPGNDVTQEVVGGLPCFVYVRVRNQGMTPSAASDLVRFYWAKGNLAGFWPGSWDGSKNVPLPKLGEPIGTLPVGVVLPGQTTIVECPWTAPVPSDYTAKFGAEDIHFCLLSRIESSSVVPFGMTYPEGPLLTTNVLNNARVAWRNIHIAKLAPDVHPWAGRQGILVANYTPHRMSAAITFELLDDRGRPMAHGGHTVYVGASGDALERLKRAPLPPDAVRASGHGEFEVVNLERGVEHVRLAPGEVLPLTVRFQPSTALHGAVLRVRQFALDGQTRTLLGGQTFVYGHVRGFRVQPGPMRSAR